MTTQFEAITKGELDSGEFDRELCELWTLSATPADGRHARLSWVAREFSRKYAGTPEIRPYKRIDYLTR